MLFLLKGLVFISVCDSPLQTGFFAYKENPPPPQSRCSSASLHRCVGEIEIEFEECVRAAFICIGNISVCLHYMLRYVCVCVLTHCYGHNQQRLKC